MNQICNKLYLIIFLGLLYINAFSQNILKKYKKYQTKDKIIININDTIIDVEVAEASTKIHLNTVKRYYWFKQQEIRTTQGGYDGKLLNGLYKKFSPNHNLMEKGKFKFGLKYGEWIYWKPNGDIDRMEKWRNGNIINKEKKKPFFNFLKRENKSTPSKKPIQPIKSKPSISKKESANRNIGKDTVNQTFKKNLKFIKKQPIKNKDPQIQTPKKPQRDSTINYMNKYQDTSRMQRYYTPIDTSFRR